MEEDNPPSSPDSSPQLNNARLVPPTDPNSNAAGSQYAHLRTLYQLQNMLTRQLNFQQNIQLNSPSNTGNNPNEVVIDMPQNFPHNHPDNSQNNGANNAANAGETITTHEIDGTRLDLQLITSWLEQAFPFVFLLLLVWIYEHRNGMSQINHHFIAFPCPLKSTCVFYMYYVIHFPLTQIFLLLFVFLSLTYSLIHNLLHYTKYNGYFVYFILYSHPFSFPLYNSPTPHFYTTSHLSHHTGLLLFIWATAIFVNSNQAVKKQVSLKV